MFSALAIAILVTGVLLGRELTHSFRRKRAERTEIYVRLRQVSG